MNKIRQAAIIMLGMGDKYAAEILKTLDPERVEAIIQEIDKIDNVSEMDLIEALNLFFKDANNNNGIDIVTKEIFKSTLSNVAESKKFESGTNSAVNDRNKWIDIFKLQSSDVIYSLLQDENPQIISMICTLVLNTEKASRLIKHLPKELQSKVVARMANIGPVSSFAMDSIATFFEKELSAKEKMSEISVDGVEAVANIISYLDSESEKEIFEGISSINSELSDVIQEKIMPFERLAQLDKRSLQTLLSEVNNDDLVIALKGAESYIKNIFLKNMASKSADILRDELESKGPVKIANVIEAQKKIVNVAKKLASEEKIMLTTKVDTGIIF